MNIIKQGDMKRQDKTRRFACDKCGCIWEANQTEYRHEWDRNGDTIVCSCPTCGNDTYVSPMSVYSGGKDTMAMKIDTTLYLLVCEEQMEGKDGLFTLNQVLPMFVFDDYKAAFEYIATITPPNDGSIISDYTDDTQRSIVSACFNNGTLYKRSYYIQSILLI